MPSATTILALALPVQTAHPPTDMGVVNITPTVSLAGHMVYAPAALGGNLAPTTTIAGALTVNSSPIQDLGLVNVAPVVTLSANFTVIPASPGIVGNISPVVNLSGKMTAQTALAGNLLPNIAFAGALNYIYVSSGNIKPMLSLNGSLTGSVPYSGNLTATVIFNSAVLIGGPLWAPTAPCDPVDWEDTELCHG